MMGSAPLHHFEVGGSVQHIGFWCPDWWAHKCALVSGCLPQRQKPTVKHRAKSSTIYTRTSQNRGGRVANYCVQFFFAFKFQIKIILKIVFFIILNLKLLIIFEDCFIQPIFSSFGCNTQQITLKTIALKLKRNDWVAKWVVANMSKCVCVFVQKQAQIACMRKGKQFEDAPRLEPLERSLTATGRAVEVALLATITAVRRFTTSTGI